MERTRIGVIRMAVGALPLLATPVARAVAAVDVVDVVALLWPVLRRTTSSRQPDSLR
jgi:hypothetical protein